MQNKLLRRHLYYILEHALSLITIGYKGFKMLAKLMEFIELEDDKKTVVACNNIDCPRIGIPHEKSAYVRNKYKIYNCECGYTLADRVTLACMICKTCKLMRNFFHKEIFFQLVELDQTRCINCGCSDVKLKVFDRTFYQLISEKSKKIPNKKSMTDKTPNLSEKQAAIEIAEQQDTEDKKRTEVISSKGVSLPPPLPELKSIRTTPEKQASEKVLTTAKRQTVRKNGKVRLSNSEKHNTDLEKQREKSDANQSSRKTPVKTSGTYNAAWKEAHNKKRYTVPEDEFNPRERKCNQCGVKIPIELQQSRPGIKYCRTHIHLAGGPVPQREEIMSREGAKKMRGQDRHRARQTKPVL